MKKVNTKEIRELMRKHPNLDIWDKDFKSWNSEDLKEFEDAKLGIISDKISLIDARSFRTKVVRISDGKIYQSVSECIREHGFYRDEMYKMLKEGIVFKRIKYEAKKIIRISDGETYDKIADAMTANKLTDYKMRKKLRLGIEFKHVEL